MIKDFYNEKTGDVIWIANSRRALDKLDTKTKKFRHYTTYSSNSLKAFPPVFSILEDSQNRFWIGTQTEGVALFDKLKGELKSADNYTSETEKRYTRHF